MKLYGKVIRMRPGWDAPYGSWAYYGCIYNEYAQLITSDIGAMTEQECKEAIIHAAERIRSGEFTRYDGLFEIEEPESAKPVKTIKQQYITSHETAQTETTIWSDDTVTYVHRDRLWGPGNIGNWSEWKEGKGA